MLNVLRGAFIRGMEGDLDVGIGAILAVACFFDTSVAKDVKCFKALSQFVV
jgi:branched-subunit amino acid transport protein AzlD